MTFQISELADYGWNAFFTAQLDSDDLNSLTAARVMAVHRAGLRVMGAGIDTLIAPFRPTGGDPESAATVGDWLLLDPDTLRPTRLLQRKSLIKRRAAGTGRETQLIAANLDTLFIVTSCNQDFKVARLERYLSLAQGAQVIPVVVLTKADMAADPEDYAATAAALLPHLMVETLDARDPQSAERLAPWCGRGETVALVGSSGVGKSTLINTLTGQDRIATRAVRTDDDKGRHTTTGRETHRLPAGGWLLDTPGMRELGLTDSKTGIEAVFADIVALANTCRFSDCRHGDEPGCAVREAITAGQLDEQRLRRWRKLRAEEVFNTESLAERRARDRAFGKMIKRVTRHKRDQRGE